MHKLQIGGILCFADFIMTIFIPMYNWEYENIFAFQTPVK